MFFSIKEIYRCLDDLKIKDLMKTEIVKIGVDQSQEEAAILALKHNLKAVPIVDESNRFMGIVSSDAILHVLHSEDIEDFLKSAGIFGQFMDLETGSSWLLAKACLPWLIFGLFGGIFAASIVSFLSHL